MMYRMKNIISHDESIESLPKCMYNLRNPNEFQKVDEIDINICAQVLKFKAQPNSKMAELEQRQDLLLKKLDLLYERIKTISSYCKLNDVQDKIVEEKRSSMVPPEEIVLVVSPENLPWFLIILLQKTTVNMTWHIHSSVPNEKVPNILAFTKYLKSHCDNSGLLIRLIFKSVSAHSELMISSLGIPIMGNVNILRYLSYIYPNALPYYEDFYLDNLLDLCHVLEVAPEKNKEPTFTKLFTQCNGWIYNNQISVVDLAAYTVVKQYRSMPKSVPKKWLENCQKLFS